MRWYSVDKFIPLEGVQLFLITDRNGEQVIEVGHYLRSEFLYLDNLRIPNVTHFCIPAPIEIEE